MAKAKEMRQETTPLKQNVDFGLWNAQKIEASNGFSDSESSIGEESDNSVTSTSSFSSDLAEDASSSSPSSRPPSVSPSFGPLFELSEIMAQLPIKRGLSKHYHGKAQSFTSLASVRNLEDLAKKESSYSQRIKSCRSYGWGLDGRKFGPKATIKKRSSSSSSFSKGSFLSTRATRLSSCNRPSMVIE